MVNGGLENEAEQGQLKVGAIDGFERGCLDDGTWPGMLEQTDGGGSAYEDERCLLTVPCPRKEMSAARSGSGETALPRPGGQAQEAASLTRRTYPASGHISWAGSAISQSPSECPCPASIDTSTVNLPNTADAIIYSPAFPLICFVSASLSPVA